MEAPALAFRPRVTCFPLGASSASYTLQSCMAGTVFSTRSKEPAAAFIAAGSVETTK